MYKSALKIVKWYHANNAFRDKDWNDSFYDVTNAIMGKSDASFKEIAKQDDKRTLLRTRTTEGTIGFGRKSISQVISDPNLLPMFYDFFNKRDVLAKKIDDKLVEVGLVLWKRDNIF